MSLSVKEAGDTAVEFVKNVLGKRGAPVAVNKMEKGWRVLVEAIEVEALIDEQLGVYEILLDENLGVTSYERKMMRKRTDLSHWTKA